jgi:beta-glucan synthesis-associated protein KRE6
MYSPNQAVTTQNGKLVITLSETNNHNLNFMSGARIKNLWHSGAHNILGMLTSWNKLCFTTGYIEVSVSMPGSAQVPGLWPAVWTMGNLVRSSLLSPVVVTDIK